MDYKIQYLKTIKSRKAIALTGEVFMQLINNPALEDCIIKARQFYEAGDKDSYTHYKQMLPAIMWCGVSETLERKASLLKPTGYFMVDIDHIKEDVKIIDIYKKVRAENEHLHEDSNNLVGKWNIVASHITPSGHGLRFVAECNRNYSTLQENMDAFVKCFNLEEYGDYDCACKDYSRLSFIVPEDDWYCYEGTMFTEDIDVSFLKQDKIPQEAKIFEEECHQDQHEKTVEPSHDTPYASLEYRGHLVTEIISKYIDVYGEPPVGERHNFYNVMVKYFRCIVDNDPLALHALLPRFGNTADETLRQCQGICRTNTVSRIPKDFFMFLLRNGFYPRKDEESSEDYNEELKAQMMEETSKEDLKLPCLPPVFREFCSICPPDFVVPTINALLPIMGTLSSYVRADYMDMVEHSTSFFSVVYAPAGSGKSFIKKLTEPLFRLLHARDEVSHLREELFLDECEIASDDKKPKDPHVSVRIMPAINSQPEFLTKMRDNHGYHMFTVAEEVDTFKKGSRSAGNDKNDLFRMAWDNDEYGQSFKSKTTFKGLVKLYYNILLTGTPGQVESYYSNVENGMITRIGVTEIQNQSFASFQPWKKLNAVQRRVIDKYIKRCDDMTYYEPLDIDMKEATSLDPEVFITEVPWKYNYRPFVKVDMKWCFKWINTWLDTQRIKALADVDNARDIFRRRAAVRGFRLALLCTTLWEKIGVREQKIIKDFVMWWMDIDLNNSLTLFGSKYNKLYNEQLARVGVNNYKGLYGQLPNNFTKETVLSLALRNGIRSKVRSIIHCWYKAGLIDKSIDPNDNSVNYIKKK